MSWTLKSILANPAAHWKFIVAVVGAFVQVGTLWALFSSETGSRIMETVAILNPLATALAVLYKGNAPLDPNS